MTIALRTWIPVELWHIKLVGSVVRAQVVQTPVHLMALVLVTRIALPKLPSASKDPALCAKNVIIALMELTTRVGLVEAIILLKKMDLVKVVQTPVHLVALTSTIRGMQ